MGAMITFWKVGPLTFLSYDTLKLLLGDTVLHSWEVLAKILSSEEATGIICDIGMYVFSVY